MASRGPQATKMKPPTVAAAPMQPVGVAISIARVPPARTNTIPTPGQALSVNVALINPRLFVRRSRFSKTMQESTA